MGWASGARTGDPSSATPVAQLVGADDTPRIELAPKVMPVTITPAAESALDKLRSLRHRLPFFGRKRNSLKSSGTAAFDAALLAFVFGLRRGPNVDIVDAPLVVLFAQDDAIADAVLVPAQLGAIAEALERAVDVLAEPGDEALDLLLQAVATALRQHVERGRHVARGDRIGEQADRIARLLRARATDELGLEPPRLALALELDELAIGEADERALADIGVALEAESSSTFACHVRSCCDCFHCSANSS